MPKPATKTELSQLKKYCSLGFKLFPGRYDEEGKKVPVKGFKWKERASSDFNQVQKWYDQYPGCQWGMATGLASGVIVVDLDIRPDKDGRKALKEILGDIPKTVTVQTPSGGLHLYFKMPNGVELRARTKEGIDIQGTGKYVFLPPSHKGNKPYKWIVPFDPKRLLDVPRELYAKKDTRKTVKIIDTIEQQKQKASWAMARISYERAEDYNLWKDVGMCLHSIDPLDPFLLQLFHTFSRVSKKYNKRDVDFRWTTFNTDRGLTLGSLIQWASEDDRKLDDFAYEAGVYMNTFSNERFNDPDKYKELGKALFFLGERGRVLWFSRFSSNSGLSRSDCTAYWDTLRWEGDTMHDLKAWVKEDQPKTSLQGNISVLMREDGSFIIPGRKPLTHVYEEAFKLLNFTFERNIMNDELYINRQLLTKHFEAHVHMTLQRYGFPSSRERMLDAILDITRVNTFHPIKDYVKSVEWDGKDYISLLASCFITETDAFEAILKKWLVGCLHKVFSNSGEFNPVLVLDGPQNIGKSKFFRWLCSSLPDYYTTVNMTDIDKDEKLKFCSNFLAELPEIELLLDRTSNMVVKALLTEEVVNVRPAYGQYKIRKPVTLSLGGTLNGLAGYLRDKTGHRRFWTIKVAVIEWETYVYAVDVDQLWAQAYALYRSGAYKEQLPDNARAYIDKMNRESEIVDLTMEFFEQVLDVTHNPEDILTTAEIGMFMTQRPEFSKMSPNHVGIQVSMFLTSKGAKKGIYKNAQGKYVNGWSGVKFNENSLQPFDAQVSLSQQFEEIAKKGIKK